MKVKKFGIIGAGVVGTGLASLAALKRDELRARYGIDLKLCFISDFARGTLAAPEGIDAAAAARELESARNLHAMPGVIREPVELGDLLDRCPVDFVCEMTPTNYKTGQPSMGILETALSRGVSAVTCSKGAVGRDLARLKALAAEHGAELRFESSVLSGTPLISMARVSLAGCEIEAVQGIVNGTTNYILGKMEEGRSYDDALAEAQKLGYAETDPTGDVEGWDAAVKVCVMACEFFGASMTVDDVDRAGITGVTADQLLAARGAGRVIKLIAGVTRDGGKTRGYVRPTELDASHPLANVRGVTNAVTLTTDNLGDITITGPGAGAKQTAQGLLSDMIGLSL